MTYPPEVHLLRDLPFEIEETGPSTSRGHLRIVPQMRIDPDGTSGGCLLDVGPLLVVTDVVAGFLAGRVIAPDWMATSNLAVHLLDGSVPARPSEGIADEVVIDVAVRRAGRTTIVLDAAMRSVGTGREVGDAVLTFVRLPRRDGNLDIAEVAVEPGRRTSMALPGSGMAQPFPDAIGVQRPDGPDAPSRLLVTDYVRNSFGAVNGGVVAAFAAESAAASVSVVTGAPARAVDVTVTYLSQGRVGPLLARSTVLRRIDSACLVRVEVVDGGAADERTSGVAGERGGGDAAEPSGRVLVVAHVLCGPR